MTPQRLRQVEEIFTRIVELPTDEREAALSSACGSDASLRAEVVSLLRHVEPAGPFLETPALGAGFALHAAPASEDDLVGRGIGPYRVTQRWASGGMGAVYLATRADGLYEQKVAVKVVKRGMDSEEILRRFAQERRTLAALLHPNIARLLDGGVLPDGRPYLVMEYVRGVSIDRYCDEQRLTIPQRLRLFCVVCDAVRFAHQKLVIHRDLKPAHILIGDEGVPKLLDFGISKVLVGAGSAEVTVPDERRFTPEYASPEQAAGQTLSAATDVYSLGVILYELLTGRRPYQFETRTAAEVERILHGREPTAPSAMARRGDSPGVAGRTEAPPPSTAAQARGTTPERLARRLAGDLDTIVLKAMHRDPARRYASVEQFVADLERHLAGMPVLARPDSLRYRVGKFMRRHALGVALVSGAAALLVVGFAVAVWQARVARAERDAAYVARDQAEAIGDFFESMLAAADPANEGPDARVRTVLDAAALHLDAEFADRPLVRAAIRSTIGRTYLGLGLEEEAERHIRGAYDTRVALLEPGHHDVAESESDLAHLFYAREDYAQAEALLLQSLETHRRLRGDENLDTARVWNDLGAVRRAAGRIDEAEDAYQKALAIREKLAGRESVEVAETLNNLVSILEARGDAAGALETMSEALDIRRRLLRERHPLVIQSIANLAVVSARAGDARRGEELLRRAVELDREVFGDQHPALATDLHSLAAVLFIQERFSEAEPLLREVIEIRGRLLDADDWRLIRAQVTLARCLAAVDDSAGAEQVLEDVLDKARRNPELFNDSSWPGVIDFLAKLYRDSGKIEKAEEMRELSASIEGRK